MAANCPECGWSGTSADVVLFDGYCPRCFPSVRVVYDSAPVSASVFVDRVDKVEQFNKRALIALASAGLNEFDKGFLASVRFEVDHYATLSKPRQNILTRMVVRLASQLHDKAVVDYAETHSPKVTA